MTKALIIQGADVSFNKNEALRIACNENALEIAKILVEYGADPTAYINPTSGFHDDCCIRVAVRCGHIEMVELLLKSVDVNFNKGALLKEAADNHNLEMLKFLISKGGDVTLISNWIFFWGSYLTHHKSIDDELKYLPIIKCLFQNGVKLPNNHKIIAFLIKTGCLD